MTSRLGPPRQIPFLPLSVRFKAPHIRITKTPIKATLHSCGARLAPTQHDQTAAAFWLQQKAGKLGL